MSVSQSTIATFYEKEPFPQGEGKLSIMLVDGIFHEERFVPSCGIAALGAYLRACGFSIALFAPNNRRMSEQEAAEWILKQNPGFIC